MKIAVDAMGGDYAPRSVLEGVNLALKHYSQLETIFLVGNEPILIKGLASLGLEKHPKIEIVHTDEVVGMDESPVKGLKKKKNSSIFLASCLVKEGKANALLSAGNTGAVSSCAIFNIGLIEGVKRPAIGTIFPTKNKEKPCLILDAGATVDCTSQNLEQFSLMANIYAREVMTISKPRIGLMNVGSEEGKGNVFIKETHKTLKERAEIDENFNFIGNVEGYTILTATVDVIVTDGFTGNVILKVSEGTAKFIGSLLNNSLKKNVFRKILAFFLKPAFKEIKILTDYRNYGGAPLLGIKSPVIIAHGNSDGKAIFNAFRMAIESLEHDLCEKIKQSI